jgi:Bacterial membrane protein YfhO
MAGQSDLRPIAALALLLQIAVIPAAAWPLFQDAWEEEGRSAAAFRGATGDAVLSNGLRAAMRTSGRLAYSPLVDRDVAERALVQDGLGLNALAYRDVSVVNGSFKAIATDVLWPNDRLFYAWIRVPQPLVDSDAGLDVLGIRYVLGYRGEPVAPGLREVWAGKTPRGGDLVLFENADAGPGAFLMEPVRAATTLEPYPGCAHDRLLCRDVGRLKALRDRDVTTMEGSFNELRLTWESIPQPRVLVVTQMYRPSWTATSGNRHLEIVEVFGGFIGVSVPPGVSSVELRYRPTAIVVATLGCYASLILAALALVLTRRSGTSRAQILAQGGART